MNSTSVMVDEATDTPHSTTFTLRSLPSLLRAVGAATLLLSVSVYLLQGWGGGSDLSRYFLLLAHTVGLAAVGIFCSRWLKEQKGARLLLMITLVFISANFAIVGGFIFSIWGASASNLHGAVTWVVANTASSFLAIGSAVIVLMPLSYLGFSVIARRSSKQFSLVFLASNFMLLLPTRDEYALVGIMVALLAFIIYSITKARSVDVTLATREGFIARLILFVPLGIMLGRNMMHSMGAVMPLMLCLAILVLMRQLSLSLSGKSLVRTLLEFGSVAPIISASGSMAVLVGSDLGGSEELGFLAFCLSASALLFELSTRASSGRGFFSVIASLFLTGGFMANLFVFDSSYASVVMLIAGLVFMWFGYYTERRAALAFGLVMSAVGIAYFLMDVFQGFDINGWFSMAGIGIGAIILGSYIEKRGDEVKNNLRGLKHNLSAWGY